MAFFKSLITRGYHKKLEDSILVCDEDDSYEFQVRYLGESPISEANNYECTARAVRNIVQMAKLNKGKGEDMKVTLSINPGGVRIHLGSIGAGVLMDIPLPRITHCSVNAKNPNVFAFVSEQATELYKCHAFQCDNKKKASQIAVTLNNIFNSVFLDMKRDARNSGCHQETSQGHLISASLNSSLLA